MPLWLTLPLAVGFVFGLSSLLAGKARAQAPSTSSPPGASVVEVVVDGRRYIVSRLGDLVTVVRKDKPHVFVIFKGDERVAGGNEADDDMVELGIDLDTIAQHAQQRETARS